jgi:O-succinylbenzoate synthase
MAKATLGNAVLDAELRAQGRSLASYLGAVRDRVECGVSVGIAPSTDALARAGRGLPRRGLPSDQAQDRAGHRRRTRPRGPGGEPEILLSVDANAAYRLGDVAVFRQLDAFGLLMVEQPLHHEDLWEHSLLQREIRTDICLDESIRSAADARAAIELGRAGS